MSTIQIDIPMEKIEAFCRKWRIKELSLFGSVLREDFRPDSDVDVLVELQPDSGLNLFNWIDMIDELKEIFSRNVDLVEKDSIRNPFRQKSILSNYQVLYAE